MPSGIVVREDYDPSLPPVLGNQDQLVQVFLNLAKNAAEAIAQGGEAGEIIFTTAFRPGVRLTVPGINERITLPLEVCIHDTGPGVPEELRPNIFDPFVTTKPGGRGLGSGPGGQDGARSRRHRGVRRTRTRHDVPRAAADAARQCDQACRYRGGKLDER